MTSIPTLPSDRQLVGAVRSGSDAAWNELTGRHVPSVRAIVRGRRARRMIDQRLADLRAAIERGDDSAEGDPAVRAFRPRVLAALSGGQYGPGGRSNGQDRDQNREHRDGAVCLDDLDDLDDETDEMLLAVAFARLPEPWQTVLWHTHVERLTAAEISPLVGRTAIDVAELLHTAERGLIDAFLLEYVAARPLDADVAKLVPLLGGYVRRALPRHDEGRVEVHLASDEGASSRRLVEMISAIDAVLPPAVSPGVTGVSVDEQRRAIGTATRTFGADVLSSDRSSRVRRATMLGAVAAVVVVLVGAVFLVRRPFDNASTFATITQPPPADTTDIDPREVPGPTDGGDATDSATTTTVDLRPAVSGPRNDIELLVEPGLRPLGVAPVAAQLAVSVSAPAPVLAGGSGTLDLLITNTNDSPTEASVETVLPRGVVFEALVEGDATCIDPPDDSPFCNVVVPADGALELTMRFGLESSVVGRLTVSGELLSEPFETAISSLADLVHHSVARGGIQMIGNTLMSCSETSAVAVDIDCGDVRAGVGDAVNRWDVPMEFVGAAPRFGLVNSSTATLELSPESTVTAAHLYWSGDLDERQQSVPDDGRNANVTVVRPDGDVVTVTADRVSLGDIDATQYLGSADVTDIVRAGGAGDYLVGNVQSVEVQGSYAGWSLVVVYDDPAMPRAQRVITRPFEWIAPEPRFEYDADFPVPVVEGAPAQVSLLTFEGERGFAPEALVIGDEAIGGDAVFDSSIDGPRSPSYDNNLGVGLGVYDLMIDTADGNLPLRATSDRDGVRIAVLALTVDLAQ
ncbi:MAG: RNA polymerase sigma factor [Ilumatobacter sp.]|uniref:RNA polymerase sigma factor n=1 Tax=Ilumatobacter sp. TaxID=1967498 RepID=UPI00391CD6C5